MKKVLLSLFLSIGFIVSAFAQLVVDFSGSPTTICAGQSVTWSNLTTGGATTYTWSFQGASGSTTSNVQNPGPSTYDTPGTYTVILSADDGNGVVTETKADYIMVLATPTISVSPSSGSICASGSITLTGSGGDTYSWAPSTGLDNTTGSVVIATLTASATYTVTGTSLNGCATNTTVAVTVTSIPATPGTITGATTICGGQSTTYSIASVSGATTYSWTVPTGAVINTGQGTQTISVTYSVTGGNICVTAGNSCGTSSQNCLAVTLTNIPATPGTITGSTTICGGQSTTYSIASVSGATTYSWTVPTGAIITAGQGTQTISVTYSVTGGNICVTAGNSCGTSSQNCLAVTLTSIPATPGTITGSTTICGNQSATYSIASVSGASTYSWTVPAGAIITAGQGTQTISVTYSVTGGNICVTAGNSCGTSSQNCLAVTLTSIPATPGTITGSTTICGNQSATYSIASVSGASTYSWTVPAGAVITAGQGTQTISVTYSVTGGNICVTADNSCGASSQRCLAVTVTNPPATPGTITGLTTVCNGQAGVVYTVPNPGNPAPTYTWTIPSDATITAGQGTRSVTITFGSTTGTVCCTAGNSCGASASSCKIVTVDPNPAVGTVASITGPTTVCANQSTTYSISSVTGATTYSWTVPAGAVITVGQGTETISVTYSVTGGSVCVTASNNCSTSLQKCLTVTVTTAPPTPGAVTGLTTVCTGQADVVYTVPGVTPPAPVRTWTVPPGAVITSGQGTRSVTITFGATSGNVCCTASNSCGLSAASCATVTVSPNPQVGTVGSITGSTSFCGAQTGVKYSIGSVLYASTYTWTTTGTATVTAGQGTTTVTVDFGIGTSNVCVTASNDCSTGAQVCKTVSVAAAAPAAPGGITGLTTVCTGQTGVAYSVATVANTTYYSWTAPPGTALTSGQGTRSVTITYGAGASSGSVCVTDSNACGKSAATCKAISVSPNPQVGAVGSITGSTAFCGAKTGVIYSIGAVANASTYSWTATGTATVTAGQGTPTVTVSFGVGTSTICVSASNNCSTSSQGCKTVSVTSGVPAAPGGITGLSTVCSGQSGVAYSVATVTNTTYYLWTKPASASITAGQGTRSVTVTFGAASGSVCVSDSNACGKSAATCKAITVSANPVVGTVSTITGPSSVCAAQSGVIYSIPAVSGATTYSWTVPAGATINTGQNTATIIVTYSVTAGNICVTASNNCSTSPQQCLTVALSSGVAPTPGAITGATTVCNGQVGAYSISPVAGALSYTWTVPAGATVTSGQGTENSVITFGSSSGTVCVSAVNGCGTSAQSCSSIVVSPTALTVSTTITNTTTSALCNGSSTAIPSGGSGPYTYEWTPSGATTASATGLCFGSHTVCVTNAGGCMTCKTVYISSPTGISTLTDNGSILVYPNPANEYIIIEGTLSSSANLQVSVMNMFGQKVIDESVFADKTFSQKVNIQGIPSGVYLIEIRSGEMVRNSKIIKIQ